MARRNDHTREQLKSMIIDAAWIIVEQEGFTALTARNIAKKIQYAPGTIYNIFESMDDLYLAVNAVTMQKLYQALSAQECHVQDKGARENMKAMAQCYRNFAQDYRPHWLMLFTQVLPDGKDYPPQYRELSDLMFEPLEALLAPYYSEESVLEKKTAARALWAAVHGLCFLEETKKIPLVGDQESTIDMTEYLIDSFLEGIQK